MLSADFYGKKGFIWWSGVVEGRQDPLKIGAVRVRIFGVHSADTSEVPTEALPWAQIVHPTTGSRSFSSIDEGNWVFGFFQDGEAAQIPVVLGVFGGIDGNDTVKVPGKKYSGEASATGFQDVRPKSQVEAGPKPPSHIVDRITNEPSNIRRIGVGNLNGTGIQSTNSNLSYSCDILGIVRINTGVAYLKTTEVFRAVGAAIKAFVAALGCDPTGIWSKIVSFLTWLKNLIDSIVKMIKQLRKALELIRLAFAIVNCIVNFIKSLPQLIASQINRCINNLLTEIANAFADAVSSIAPAVPNVFSSAKDLVNEVKGLQGDIVATKSVAEATIQNIQNLPGDLNTNIRQAAASIPVAAQASVTTNFETRFGSLSALSTSFTAGINTSTATSNDTELNRLTANGSSQTATINNSQGSANSFSSFSTFTESIGATISGTAEIAANTTRGSYVSPMGQPSGANTAAELEKFDILSSGPG